MSHSFTKASFIPVAAKSQDLSLVVKTQNPISYLFDILLYMQVGLVMEINDYKSIHISSSNHQLLLQTIQVYLNYSHRRHFVPLPVLSLVSGSVI